MVIKHVELQELRKKMPCRSGELESKCTGGLGMRSETNDEIITLELGYFIL